MAARMLDHLGHACRQRREGAGATQLDVAVRAGTSHATVSRFETGIAWPVSVTVDQLVQAYAEETGATVWDLWADALARWAGS
jgi:transcriptional regulator with XRE-family HTH domain